MGRGPGSSKKSGRDEPFWVIIYKCMGATLGLSLYSYLYLKLAKMPCFSYYLLLFLLQQNQRTRGQNRFCLETGEVGGEMAQIMYTHVSKCKNDKIK
jgi:hypothetical protein